MVVGIFLLITFDRACANFYSLNPRAQSSEGKTAARCLSTVEARGCQWEGWQRWDELKERCPQVACMSSVILGRAYGLKRHGVEGADVIAVGVDVYRVMRGDTWLGTDGVPVHCVDTTTMPSAIEALFRGHARETYTVRSDDPRCAGLNEAVPSLSP